MYLLACELLAWGPVTSITVVIAQFSHFRARGQAPRFNFVYLILYSYDLHSYGLLPPNLCLVTLLSLEQCLQFERFRLQHIQVVNKTSSFKTKLIGNNAEASRIDCNIL